MKFITVILGLFLALPAYAQIVPGPTPPAGSNGQLQYNNNGVFGGTSTPTVTSIGTNGRTPLAAGGLWMQANTSQTNAGVELSFASSLANGLTASPTPIFVNIDYTGTDQSSGFNPVGTDFLAYNTYGTGGTASVGTIAGFNSTTIIAGTGSDNNEYAGYGAFMLSKIGTGYTQTTGPSGRYWVTDFDLHGPIAVQESLYQGITMFGNQYYNGSPSSAPSYLLGLITKKGSGGGGDSLHTAASTYPMDFGMVIAGDSNSGAATAGFTTAIGVCPTAAQSGWQTNTSYCGVGIDIRNTHSSGIYIIGGSNSNYDFRIDSAGGSVGLGKKASSSTPIIDFMTSGSTTNYDERILGVNGNATDGSGNFIFYADADLFQNHSNTTGVLLVPSTPELRIGSGGVIGFSSNADANAAAADTAFRRNAANTMELDNGTLGGSANLIITGLKTTGSAGSKNVVCVDTSTGKLYASSSGSTCAN